MSDEATIHYHRAEIQDVLDAGPHPDETWFSLQVSGAEKSKHLSISPDQLVAIRDILAPADPGITPRLDLDRANDGSAFIAITYFDATGTPERTSVLSHAYGVVVDSVMKRKFEQMLELMGGNVTSDITNAFKHPADNAASGMAANDVLVLTIDHRQGYEVSVHRSQESATSNLIAWVEQFWHQDGPTGDMPDDPDEAIKAYFDFADESYHIHPASF